MEIIESISEPLTIWISDSRRSFFPVKNNVYCSNFVCGLNDVSVVITKEIRRAKTIDIFLNLGNSMKISLSIRRSAYHERSMSECNRPRSIYQYSNVAPRLPGQTSIFGVVFFVSKSLLGIERLKSLEKFAILTRKPRSHVRILIYRTWPIDLQFPRGPGRGEGAS